MNANVAFMRNLEEDYIRNSKLKDRSAYKIFYGQVFQAPILTLGLNPAGIPEEISADGAKGKGGTPASASGSFFENFENDVLDCNWPENDGLRKLLLPLVGDDHNRFRKEIVKSNIAFRRSPSVSGIDMRSAAHEAMPYICRIIDWVRPKLIVLTGPKLAHFLSMYASGSRPLAETVTDSRIGHIVFAAAAAKLTNGDVVVVQVDHASQFSWTYERYDVTAKIRQLVAPMCSSECATMSESATSKTHLSALAADTSAVGVPKKARLAELAVMWRELGIVSKFHLVHHSASKPFTNKFEQLDRFIAWCDAREIKAENNQTVERALAVARSMRSGARFEDALRSSWSAYPTVTR